MWNRHWIVACGLVLIAVVATPATAGSTNVDHEPWDALVKKHVRAGGWVDYAGFAEDAAKLDVYLEALGGLTADEFDALSEDAQLATLINAYNAFTIRLILDHWNGGELASIMDIPEAKRWKHERWKVAGRTISLDQLEHEWIREDYDEPRIHWALVCAAYSCPPLRTEAFTGDKLDAQLADQERLVLRAGDRRFVRDDAERYAEGEPRPQVFRTVAVTRLFEWYGEDFGDDWRAYLQSRVEWPLARGELAFIDYDWKLNDLRNRPK